MKLKITLKDPDGVWESIQEAVDAKVRSIPDLSDEERDALAEKRKDILFDLIGQWVKYSEYVTIEIDTDAGTAVVCKT